MEARHRCRILTNDYNNLDPRTVAAEDISDVRFELLKKLVGRVGEGTFVEPPFRPDYGCNVVIGRDCFINWKWVILISHITVQAVFKRCEG